MAKTSRPATAEEIDVCKYLNELRESGVTNMLGARPYIERQFGYDKVEAGRLMKVWMENFNDDGDYSEIVVDE